jgi:predicted nucleic acid-binding protein
MNAFVLDCSVTMSWALPGEDNTYASAVRTSFVEYEAIVPSIWVLEVANGLLVAERRGRLRRADTVEFVALLGGLPILIDRAEPDRALGEILPLAREQNLSSYDAAYLDLAMREGLPLATLDESLRQAAQAVGVAIAAP